MSSDGTIRQVVRFGIFEVDLQRRELYRGGVKTKLRDQSFLLLTALLERPRELVTRDELRNKLWPSDTFVDFDHSLNAAIKRLRDALGDDPDNPRFIETVPKRGYRFLAPVDAPSSGHPETANPRPGGTVGRLFRSPVLAVVLLVSTLVVGFGVMRYVVGTRALAKPPLRIVPLTTYPGAEFDPAFSGDGEQVAFVWDGNTVDRTDVYVKRIGIDPPLQLTHGGGFVCCPRWTSDNRFIAFERCSSENTGIYLVPALGGQERRLRNAVGCNGLSWSPKEQLLVFSDKSSPSTPWALFRMSLDDLQPHQLTFPPDDVVGDHNPVFSPNGETVAFTRIVGEGATDVYTVPLSGGVARRLTFDKTNLEGVAWTADAKDLIFSSRRDGSQSLWVAPADGGEPKRLPLGGAVASNPAISRQGNRLSYRQGYVHPDLWALDISGRAARQGQAKRFLSSATYNNAPKFSPDGKKLAFASRRSGDMEIWTCDVKDCSQPQQLTFLRSLSGTPRWSPDGQRISFESRPGGHSQIFVVSATGGKPLPLTDGKFEDKVSSWSPDGTFIYFASNRSGASQIWKIAAASGKPSQVTQHGGFVAFESSDAKFLYYIKDDRPGVWRMPAAGGDEIKISPLPSPAHWGDWALVDTGIYYADDTGDRPAIEFLAFDTHKVSKIAEVESLPPGGDPGFTVSPDENWLIFSQVDRSAVDLMLVENFRVEP
jgi:Tol biopolymer transport system component/DNA-binding winged helix-turn-helix (wHTH) protein